MRILGLLGLSAATGGMYLAQYIIHQGNPASLLPPHFVASYSALRRFSLWLPQDLHALALILTLISLLAFSLTAPLWRGEVRRRYRAQKSARPGNPHSPTRFTRTHVTLTYLLSSAALLLALFNTSLSPWPPLVTTVAGWLAILAALAAWTITHRRRAQTPFRRADNPPISPYRSWPWLAIILGITGALHLYIANILPATLDPLTLRHAELAHNAMQSPPIALGSPPWLVLSITHLLANWTGDLFQAGAWRALGASLGAVTGVWLLGNELFRRTPHLGMYGGFLEDDGAFPALLAAAIFPALAAFVHYARVPFTLEPVAFGLGALWCLLAGARQRNTLLIGTGGLLSGLLVTYGGPGAVWILLGLVTWLGIRLLHRPWLAGRWIHVQPGAPPRLVEAGIGARAFGVWLWGVLITASLTLLAWLPTSSATQNSVSLFNIGLSGNPLWTRARDYFIPTLSPPAEAWSAALVWPPELVQAAATGNRLIDTLLPLPSLLSGTLLGPLLLLSLGILLLNLDHLFGWLCTIWLPLSIMPFLLLDVYHPAWAAWMAPALPVIALAIALTLDRARVAIFQTLGTWPIQATVYACMGVVIASLANHAVNYIEFAGSQRSAETELVRLLPGLAHEGAWYLAASREERLLTHSPTVRFILRVQRVEDPITITDQNWPTAPAPGAAILIDAREPDVLRRVQAEFRPGRLKTIRDLRSDPILYIYRLLP